MMIRPFPVWIASALAIIPCAHAAQPWDEPFAKDTRAIALAAREITPADNPGMVVLLDEYRYVVHTDGRAEVTHRKVYRVTQHDAVEAWSSAEQGYRPWYQKKPEIRARVIGPEGDAHLLDAKTIADSPAGDADESIFTDARVARAPLPSVTDGSVVEYEIAVADTAPLLDAGVAQRIAPDGFVPLERFHVVVDAEIGVSLRFTSKLIPDSAVHRTEDGKGTRVECDFGPYVPPKNFEGYLPPDVASTPYVAFSTGKSWQAVAARYAAIVDQKLQAGDWKPFLDGVDLKGDARAVASRLAAKLHGSVRYTGVEFGEAAIVPGAPAETIRRGYGDCKDKSTLLTAMLRAAGLKADVALLLSGYATDVDAELPGMGVFNHAIVHVAGDPELWIDATAADTRVGFLPPEDQGRLALIANGESAGLVRIPESSSADNQLRDSYEVRMSEFGSGSIREVFEASGGMRESIARSTYGQEEAKVKERVENYVKVDLAAKSAGKYSASRRDDMSGPFQLDVEALESKLSETNLDDAGVATKPWLLFDDVPYALKLTSKITGKDEEKRRHDFVFPEPYRYELRYKIIPPPLFRVANVPKSQEVKIGSGSYSRNYQTNPDGSFEAVYRFDSGKRRLTAEEFEAYRAELEKYDNRAPEVITFYPETAEYVALGQSGKALAMVREATSAHAESAMAHVRLAHMLLTAHLGGPARAEARKATELDANSTAAWQGLASAYEHDTFGRLREGNWDRVEAETCYRKALALDPENQLTKMALAILLEFNAQGWRYAEGSRVDEAIALYREILKKDENAQVRQNLTIALLRAGKLDEAKEEAKKSESAFQATVLAMIAAMQDGPARAIINAQSSYPDTTQRAQFLVNVGVSLTQFRQYSSAAAIIAAAARLNRIPGAEERAELVGKIKRWEDAMVKEDDPRWPIQRLILETYRNNLTRDVMAPLLSSRADFSAMEAGVSSIWNKLAAMRRLYSGAGFAEESMADITLSMLELSKEGDDAHGYRIGSGSSSSSSAGIVRINLSSVPPMYVVKEDGKYKLIGAGTEGTELIGSLVLDLLAKHDLAGAQWWLDQVVQMVEAHADGTGMPVIRSIWSGVTPDSRGAYAIQLAAQVLIATSTGKPDAIQKLIEARPKAANALDKAQLDKAICESLVKAKNWEGLLPAARQLQTNRWFSEEAFRYYILAAKGLHKWPELAAEARKRYDTNKSNEAAIKALVLAEAGQGNWARAAEWAKEISKSRTFEVEQAETAAWTAILAGKATEETLSTFHEVKEMGAKWPDYNYTEAMLEASLHQPDKATEALIRAIGDEDYFHLHPAAWAAYARICEQFGYADEANQAMARARAAVHEDDEITDWVNVLLYGGVTEKRK